MKIDFFNSRKYTWLLNAIIFNLCRVIPFRNKKLWIFGAREGHQYEDNSRYLYEYVNKKYKDKIRVVWLTSNKEVVDKINVQGREAYLWNSLKGELVALQAGVAFYTNGLIDFGLFPLVGGAKIVSLWHGVGFKRTYNAKYYGWQKKVKKAMDVVFSWTYRNITIATSEYNSWQFAQSYSYPSKHVTYIAGQPRNDIFKKDLQKKLVLSKVDIDYNKRVILYMPTYRGKEMGEDAMAKIVKDLYYNKELDKILNDTNSIFVAKLHPLTPHIDISNRRNFVIMDYGVVESNQELLAVSDVLVTDYSSCCVDFALLNRPVVFYQPDEEEFIKKSEPIFEELFDILKSNSCTEPKELADKIANPSMVAVDKLNKTFEDGSIKGTCYSENVYQVIAREIGL